MNYELAKKLKDAGFPKKFWGTMEIPGHPEELKKTWYPTLEELIEACGEDFDSMYLGSDGSWLAESPMYEENGKLWIEKGEGSTPSEAVANLWLSLKVTPN